MIKISDLPKEPISALQAVLAAMIGKAHGGTEINKLRESNHPVYRELLMLSVVAKKAAERIQDDTIRESVFRCITFPQNMSLDGFRNSVEMALSMTVALQFEDHFIDEELEQEFNLAELSLSEKTEIRELMNKARGLVDRAETLEDWAKRRVLFHISRIENELHRTASRFQSFLAAAADMSGLVKKVGNDAQPIADAIQKARTITERKVQGYSQIEQEPAPKQLPKPKQD